MLYNNQTPDKPFLKKSFLEILNRVYSSRKVFCDFAQLISLYNCSSAVQVIFFQQSEPYLP